MVHLPKGETAKPKRLEIKVSWDKSRQIGTLKDNCF
jgi:hypothetical protein